MNAAETQRLRWSPTSPFAPKVVVARVEIHESSANSGKRTSRFLLSAYFAATADGADSNKIG